MKKHNRSSIILIYCIAIAIILDSATMYTYLKDFPLYGHGFGWPMGVICLLYVLQSKKIKKNYSLAVRLPVLLLLLLVYAAVTRYNIRSYFVSYVGVFLCLFVFAYFLYQNHEMKSFLRAFSNVMLAIALISLVCWVFGSILNVLPGRTALTYFWADHDRSTYTYFYVYFENATQNIGYDIVRNVGVFTEAPGFSGFLTYGLIIELALRKDAEKKNKKQVFRILIYAVTLLSTGSTKGVLAVIIAFLVEYFARNTKTPFGMGLKGFVGVFIVVVAAIIGMRLLATKLATGPGIVRMDDMLAGIKTFIQNPIFGAGYNNSTAIIRNQLVSRSNTGLSMGLTVLLAFGGLWMFCIYAGAVIVSYRSSYFKKHRKTWFLICLVLLYNLFVSNSGFSDPYIFVIAAAYAMPVKRALSVRRVGGLNAHAATQP